LHHYFKQFSTCLKYDAINTNYCITIFIWAGPLAWPGLAWAGLGWPGLGWAGLSKIFQKVSKNFPVTKAL
jgi:hypothetical protein